MNKSFLRRLTAPLSLYAVSVIPNLCGCVHAAPPLAPPPAIVAPAASTIIGGIKYDPAAPLDAVVVPKFDVKSPPETALTYSVKYKGANGEMVPALLTVPTQKLGTSNVQNVANAAKFPCVLLGHGINGKKEDMFLLAIALARQGYASFVLDTAGHGERPKIGGKPVMGLSSSEFHQMCAQTIVDCRRAVDYLQTRPDLDATKFGYVGVSLGGILGGVFVGEEPRIKTAVFWAAGGNWGKLITTTQLRDSLKQFVVVVKSGKNVTTTKITEQTKAADATESLTAEAIEKVMSDVDPINFLPKAAGHPLLFINGDKDVIVPVPCAEELYARVKEPKQRIILPGGHIPDVMRMATETMKFLQTNLPK